MRQTDPPHRVAAAARRRRRRAGASGAAASSAGALPYRRCLPARWRRTWRAPPCGGGGLGVAAPPHISSSSPEPRPAPPDVFLLPVETHISSSSPEPRPAPPDVFLLPVETQRLFLTVESGAGPRTHARSQEEGAEGHLLSARSVASRISRSCSRFVRPIESPCLGNCTHGDSTGLLNHLQQAVECLRHGGGVGRERQQQLLLLELVPQPRHPSRHHADLLLACVLVCVRPVVAELGSQQPQKLRHLRRKQQRPREAFWSRERANSSVERAAARCVLLSPPSGRPPGPPPPTGSRRHLPPALGG
eukprot:COSAG01_NODE_1825_length_9137_cov_246.763886_6_plen_304_part_00